MYHSASEAPRAKDSLPVVLQPSPCARHTCVLGGLCISLLLAVVLPWRGKGLLAKIHHLILLISLLLNLGDRFEALSQGLIVFGLTIHPLS